jgi:hypothetical protein
MGTTLIEILVVIVVFLVGILAVVQIFPKGFQLLILNRNKIVAQALARDYVEMLKSRPDQLPEQIVSAYYDGFGNLVVASGKDPGDLGTLVTSLNSNGFGLDGNNLPLGSWQYYTGSNIFRRVIGEGQRVPSPRQVGSTLFGGLMVLQFGPINFHAPGVSTPANISVYGNDLQQIVGVPTLTTVVAGTPGTYSTAVQRTDYQYFVNNPTDGTISIYLPTGSNADPSDPSRSYRVSFSAYVTPAGGGAITKRDYIEVNPPSVPNQPLDPTGQFPLYGPIALQSLVPDTIQSVDVNTLRVQRFFLPIDKSSGTAFSATNPYQYKLLNENLGVLLFNPIGNGVFVSRLGHDREPLTARVNYDVYDWRILHDDFRIDAGVLPGEVSSDNPQALFAQHKLPIGSIKVANQAGADGLPNTPIPNLEVAPNNGTTDVSVTNAKGADNVVLMDLDTGGVFFEYDPVSNLNLITVNKSTGVITVYDADGDPTNGITGKLLLPDGTTQTIQMDNRAVRALYMANNEYSVQVLKAASQYTVSGNGGNLSTGQFYVGGTILNAGLPYRIYFPQADHGRKINVGEVTYNGTDGFVHDLVGQDFLVKPPDAFGLPYIDLTDADPNAVSVNFANGFGVRNVKGMSVAVRVLWNPTVFHLTGNSGQNLSSLSTWGQAWRKSTNETFLQKEDNNR